jgi:hypothetical protein
MINRCLYFIVFSPGSWTVVSEEITNRLAH